MRIATFNLENLSEQADGGTSLDVRCRALRPYLKRLDADVLCLQEVGGDRVGPKGSPRQFRALSRLLDGTDYSNYFRTHSTTKDGHGPLDVHNLVTLSRFPILRSQQFWNDLVSPPRHQFKTSEGGSGAAEPVTWDRPALYVELDLGTDNHLHVFNLHLRAPLAAFVPGQKLGPFKWRTVSGWAEGFFVAAVKRSGQALEVRFAIDDIFDNEPGALIALCGDMNAEAKEMPLRILCGDEMDTENPALEARVMVPMENATSESRRYSVIHGGRPSMLDHMLVSPALFKRFQTIEIHNERLSDELLDYRRAEKLEESHHAPIVAQFET